MGKATRSSSWTSLRAVHPHAGGESKCSAFSIVSASGSSPRGWGKLTGLESLTEHVRFIPTRVGKALVVSRDKLGSPVHPHAGGESGSHQAHNLLDTGSSPRGWGKRLHQWGDRCASRFIPTRVGKARNDTIRTGATPVHPHAGGESSGIGMPCTNISGSSPRGWGKRNRSRTTTHYPRFIPTRVGKASLSFAFTLRRSVHPHAGGESHVLKGKPNGPSGSSPRGWGKRPIDTPYGCGSRFIPTRVGKAFSVIRFINPPPVHPHAGGESNYCESAHCASGGSSPRGWGKLILLARR